MDEAYTQLLNKILGGPTLFQFRKEHTYDYIDMMRDFEVAKRNMTPTGRISFNTRLPATLNICCKEQNGETIQDILEDKNFPYKGQIKLIGDKLSIKSEIMKSIFLSVTKNIIEHTDTILADDHVKDCSLILLVGGFSESEIVQNEIRKKFETEERRVIIPAEAGLSVLKGATITGHAQDIVTQSCFTIQLWCTLARNI